MNFFRGNKIYLNGGAAITVDTGTQNGALPPVLTGATDAANQVTGTSACTGTCTIEAFDNNPSEDEARTSLGTVTIVGPGIFTITVLGDIVATRVITVILTLPTGDTSAVSGVVIAGP